MNNTIGIRILIKFVVNLIMLYFRVLGLINIKLKLKPIDKKIMNFIYQSKKY